MKWGGGFLFPFILANGPVYQSLQLFFDAIYHRLCVRSWINDFVILNASLNGSFNVTSSSQKEADNDAKIHDNFLNYHDEMC